MTTVPYPTPRSMTALLERAQATLASARSGLLNTGISPLVESNSSRQQPEALESAMESLRDNMNALRSDLVRYRLQLMSDETTVLQHEISHLQKDITQKSTAIAQYTSLLTRWHSTLVDLSSSTTEALSRSYRDESLIQKYASRAPPRRFVDEDYAELDDVDDNPHKTGADGIPNLSPVLSSRDSVAPEVPTESHMDLVLDVLPPVQASAKLDGILDDLSANSGLGGDVLAMTSLSDTALPAQGEGLASQSQGFFDMFGDSMGSLDSSPMELGGFGMESLDVGGFDMSSLSSNTTTLPTTDSTMGLGSQLVDSWDTTSITQEEKLSQVDPTPPAELSEKLDFDEFLV
ncbi:uncharacterized protein SPPG_03644 [Spizellomyces punctatus DAOM BR117]|uniref:Uncharacterized protein n=1 Tax=Spizellomyces punctatus (strain DAOM BR117) TaxID=645134 RepID=A0A0L0HM05_SPIPD|nr:uncharacterized protein SPPG_03644 [Spizellomyces punctatus DAOM BR117]KND01854.1 hypothetical protein SPPG_03644 [Spizellomyces punctatus DAOM BR117]|eukprot:XP_016609893.1 hypothetical protein SPPG_03644 [Spizellomyces punctatus DAOM BR117]